MCECKYLIHDSSTSDVNSFVCYFCGRGFRRYIYSYLATDNCYEQSISLRYTQPTFEYMMSEK